MIHALQEFFLHNLQSLGAWSYGLLFILVVLEGPVTTVLAAAAAWAGLLQPALVCIVAVCANLLADLFWFGLGLLMPAGVIARHGRWLGLREAALPCFQERVRRDGANIIFTAKLTVVFAMTALLALGFSRVPLRRWFLADAMGECLWTGSLVLGSMQLISLLDAFERALQIAVIVGYAALIAALACWARRQGRAWETADSPATAVAQATEA